MISPWLIGNTGNHLFLYTAARLLAEESGVQFESKPIEHFPELVTHIPGNRREGHFTRLTDADFAGGVKALAAKIKDSQSRFSVGGGSGSLMESYWIYRPYRERIRSWFKPASGDYLDQTVLHVRGHDHKTLGRLPRAYYKAALSLTGDSALVVTDEPEWDFVQSLELPIVHSDKMTDFNFIRRSRRIIMSFSTFAWWAAFLSDAEMVIQPVPCKGFRSVLQPETMLHVPQWASIPCIPLWGDEVESI